MAPLVKRYKLVIIILLFFLFRFYNIHHRVIFDWDQERDAWQIFDLFVNHKPTLIGPRVVNVNGFFLAPYYTYLLAPFYLATRLHPYGSILFLVAYNVVFFVSGWWIVQKLFSYRHALLFLLFWGTNSLLITYDIIPWNPLLIPLGILITWYMLYRIYKKMSLLSTALLGFILCFFLNFHVQFVFVILQAIVFCLLAMRQNKMDKLKKLKHIAIFAGAFLLPLAPLALFDLRHGFLNSHL